MMRTREALRCLRHYWPTPVLACILYLVLASSPSTAQEGTLPGGTIPTQTPTETLSPPPTEEQTPQPDTPVPTATHPSETPTDSATPGATFTPTKEAPTPTFTQTPGSTIPQLIQIPAEKILFDVSSFAPEGEPITITLAITLPEQVNPTGQANIALNIGADLVAIGAELTTSSATDEMARTSITQTYSKFPMSFCPGGTAAEDQETVEFLALYYYMKEFQAVSPGSTITATAVLKMLSDSGQPLPDIIEVNGAFIGGTQHGPCMVEGQASDTIATKYQIFLPQITAAQ